MRFRLTYEGELRPGQRDAVQGQSVPLADHKHIIRKGFHRQLRHLWKVNSFLRSKNVTANFLKVITPMDGKAYWTGSEPEAPLSEVVANQFQENGYRFAPLALKAYALNCTLDILFLRRDPPGSILHAGDIDNRIKTLIDTLRKPGSVQELGKFTSPDADEDPFFCLLEDDSQVTQLSVETDTLLDPPTTQTSDVSRVKLVITVNLSPYDVDTFNLNFS